MTLKKELLSFLYRYRDTSVTISITSTLSKYEPNRELMIETLRHLSQDRLLSVDDTFRQISTRRGNQTLSLEQVNLHARILPDGEDYVQKHYLPKNDSTPTIHAQQVVYAGRDILGATSQADNQSSSHKTTTKTAPAQQATIKKIVIGVFVSVVAGLILWYLTTSAANQSQTTTPTTDTTTILKQK